MGERGEAVGWEAVGVGGRRKLVVSGRTLFGGRSTTSLKWERRREKPEQLGRRAMRLDCGRWKKRRKQKSIHGMLRGVLRTKGICVVIIGDVLF